MKTHGGCCHSLVYTAFFPITFLQGTPTLSSIPSLGETGKMTQRVMCLLCQHEDLSSESKNVK